MTYRELNERANQLAHELRARGVGPEALVGVCLERSLEMVIALLAVLKAGGAYLPLAPDYPHERLAFMVADAQATVLLTNKEIGDWRLEIDAPEQSPISNLQSPSVIAIDAEWERIAQQPATDPESGVSADNLAYVIYTSGSTGTPKGAMNSHRAIVNRLLWMQERYRLGADDRVMQKTPFSFDVSVWEFFWPLLAGATLVLARPGGHQDPAYLAELIPAHRITTLHFVPSMLQAFLAAPGTASCGIPTQGGAGLRRVVCSGEELPRALVERFFARLGAHGVELHNLYGPTEAAVDVSAWECRPAEPTERVPIGHPVANTQLYILDPQLQPVPIGVPGELYIGGVQLARGYHRRPDLTAERFVPNPFAQGRLEIGDWRLASADATISNLQSPISDRLYKTGDLCRYREDGAIEYLGRRDFQVKLRGFRIELGEIEAALRQHPQVREALVALREDVIDDRRLVAYIVAGDWRLEIGDSGGVNLQSPISNLHQELRGFLKNHLPDYMLPAAFVLLDALPLSPNGKLDRRALPAPDSARPALEDAFLAPRTPVEETVARTWTELLGVERVGIRDNFFALGGHSLLMTQVVSRIWETFGVELPIQSFFQDPTVAGLALNITQLQAAQHDTDEISQLLEQLDQMSEADLQALVESQTGPQPSASHEAGPTSVEPASDTRYRRSAVERFPVGDDMELLYARRDRSPQLVPAETSALLDRCLSFQTLDEHARACAGVSASDAAVAAVKGQLLRLVAAGCLVSEQAIFAPSDSSLAADAPTRIASVAFPTSRRLDALQRALASYIEHCRHYGRTNDFVVIEDSPDAATRNACRELLGALKARYTVPIRYAGLEEKRDFAQRLAGAGELPPEIVEFALFGEPLGLGTIGANRNGLSLHTAGDLVLSVDDDTLCRVAAAPHLGDGLRFASGHAHTDTWVFPDREALLRSVPFVETDLLALHEPLLGRELRACAAAFSARGPVTVEHADERFLQRIASGAGRVLVTLNGLAGDCGWGSPTSYLFLAGDSFERLTRSEDAYRAACTSREILRVPPQVTLTDRVDNLMTTFFGLDNRELVPPFLPVGRGSDAIFGLTLAACLGAGHVAHLPWAVLHSPIEARAFWPGEVVRSASGIDISLMMMLLIHSFEAVPAGVGGAEGLRRLGRHIEQIALLPGPEFEEFLRLRIWRGASSQIAALEERLRDQGDAPAYWAADVRKYIELLRQSLAGRELAVPLELLPGRGSEAARDIARRLAMKFGQLLYWWPALVETTRALREQGYRLARPI